MKAQKTLGFRCGKVVNNTPRLLFPLKRAPVLTVEKAGWPPRLVCKGMEKRISHSVTGVQTRAFQPVVSHYMDCHIPVPTLLCNVVKLLELIMLASLFFILFCVYIKIFNKCFPSVLNTS